MGRAHSCVGGEGESHDKYDQGRGAAHSVFEAAVRLSAFATHPKSPLERRERKPDTGPTCGALLLGVPRLSSVELRAAPCNMAKFDRAKALTTTRNSGRVRFVVSGTLGAGYEFVGDDVVRILP